MELYFEITATPPRIVDGKGRVWTSFQAKAFVEAGKVEGWNIAFQRLIEHDYDPVATLKSYD